MRGYHARYLVPSLEASLLSSACSWRVAWGVHLPRTLFLHYFWATGTKEGVWSGGRGCDERGVWGVWGGRERAVCGGYGKVGRERGK